MRRRAERRTLSGVFRGVRRAPFRIPCCPIGRARPSVGQWIRLPAAGADNVAPTAPVALTATGAVGRIDLDWGASTDAVGVTGYDVHRATTAGFTPTPANRIAQTTTATEYADASAVPGTTYHYLVLARDAAANLSPPSNGASAVALGDTNAPTVSITQPAAGSTVLGAVTLAANATDDVGVTSVQFRVDGANVGAADTSSPYSISWSSTSVANGAHQISAVARDAAGNTTTSAAVGVTVSNTAPPGPAGLVGAWSFDQAGTAPDASGTGNNGTINGATWTAAGRFVLVDGSAQAPWPGKCGRQLSLGRGGRPTRPRLVNSFHTRWTVPPGSE